MNKDIQSKIRPITPEEIKIWHKTGNIHREDIDENHVEETYFVDEETTLHVILKTDSGTRAEDRQLTIIGAFTTKN